MKSHIVFFYALIITSVVFVSNSYAQVLNGSFEISNDSISTIPKDWNFKNNKNVQFSLTSDISASGKNSFLINLTNNYSSKNFYFSQSIPFQGKRLQRIILSYYTKSDLEGKAGVWWQVRDQNNNQIGFTNSGLQNQEITGKSDWTKHTLLLNIDENCTKFIIGGYFRGKGKIWFDDFKVENVILPNTKPSKSVKKYLKEFKKIVKKHSLYADSLNWKQIDKDLNYLSKGISSIDDVAAPKNYILNKLKEAGDNHSFIASKKSFENSQQGQTSTSVPYAKSLENNIGYINVPDFSSRNDSVNIAFATKIQQLIRDLDTKHNIHKWIVDLRDNPGGNMHPMLAGLGPLLGEGTSGNFVSGRKKRSVAWFYKDGAFGVGNRTTTKIDNPYYLKQSTLKIAVLIGANTGSSGEMTAIAFIGKENTQLFGQTSAGYTTTNQDYKLPNGDRIYLASGYVSDRNNKIYPKNIIPEIQVIEDEKSKDKTLNTAVDWLKK